MKDAQELKRVWSHSAEVVTAGLDGLDEETTGSWVAVHSADEILHWRLMGQADEVTHMVDYQPGQMLWVMKVLTLLFQEKNQNEHVNLKFCVIKIFFTIIIYLWLTTKYVNTIVMSLTT